MSDQATPGLRRDFGYWSAGFGFWAFLCPILFLAMVRLLTVPAILVIAIFEPSPEGAEFINDLFSVPAFLVSGWFSWRIWRQISGYLAHRAAR